MKTYHPQHLHPLSGPISRDITILLLRYPISRDTFSGRAALREGWVSIKLLSAKFGFTPPPPKRAQNEEKLYKSVENPPN